MKLLLTLKQKLLLRRSSFPSLDGKHVPELASVSSSGDGESSSSDEESVERRRKEYHTKEDEDVAYFLNIANRLSVESLIFLLQNHARHMHNVSEAELNAALERKEQKEEAESIKKAKGLAIPRIKKFRFAEISTGKVRTIVHENPQSDEVDNDCQEVDGSALWWTQEEYGDIRLEAAQLVKFYRKHEQPFLDSIAVLADPEASKSSIDASMKLMLQNLNTRGLESHMSSVLSQPRSRTVRAVLIQQQLCGGATSSSACERIRQASLKESAANLAYATRMGGYDHVEALKASLSRWRKPRPNCCNDSRALFN